MNTFKEKCIELRKLDYSLIEISKITKRPKNSVYFHVKDIPLSLSKQENIKIARISRISGFSAARRGRSLKKFKTFNKWDENLVNLISHFMFDGEIKRDRCVYNNRNLALLRKVESHMYKLYNFEPTRYLNKLTGVNRISYFNVALSAYIKKKSIELLDKVPYWSKSLKQAFLMAFFDDEGCIDFRIHRRLRRVRGYQKNIKILVLVQKLLNDLGIDSAIHKPNEVVIMGKINLEKFKKEINFSRGVLINGNRSNSIWKKSLEKRFILDQAIKSFKS